MNDSHSRGRRCAPPSRLRSGRSPAPARFAQDAVAPRTTRTTSTKSSSPARASPTRTRLDSLAPVDVLSADALTRQATTELAEALATAAPRSTSRAPPSPTARTTSARRRCAAWRPTRRWCWSTASAATSRRWSTSTAPSAAARPPSTSTPSRSPRSNPSKCCATAPRRNTARTPSPASSTCACAMRAKAATPAHLRRLRHRRRDRARPAPRGRRRDHDRLRLGRPAARRRRLPDAVRRNTAIAIPPAAAISTTACPDRRSPRAIGDPTSEDITVYANAGMPLETTGASTAGPAISTAKATPPPSRASSTTRATCRLSTRTASCR